MKLPLTGGCQCGVLRYEISTSPGAVFCCHCTDCQRMTSSSFSLGFCLVDAPFYLTGPEPRLIQRVADSGETRNRWVCPDCGCWLCGGSKPGSQTPDRLRLIRGGSLDDPSWLTPRLHFWVRSKQPWVVLPNGSQCFETQPTNLYEFLLAA
jgi:hypothetical protein